MKNKKGFTLIELLAVIIVLAIIMVIAVPKILDVIESSKKSAAKASAELYVDAVEKNNVLSEVSNAKYTKILDGTYDDVTILDVNVKGTKPTSGTMIIENGKVKEAELCINNYNIIYNGTKSTITGSCGTDDSELDNSTFAIGDIVYYNPVTATFCENNEGKCYPWIVLNVYNKENKFDLMYAYDDFRWSSNLMGDLESYTSDWDESLKVDKKYNIDSYIDYSDYKARIPLVSELNDTIINRIDDYGSCRATGSGSPCVLIDDAQNIFNYYIDTAGVQTMTNITDSSLGSGPRFFMHVVINVSIPSEETYSKYRYGLIKTVHLDPTDLNKTCTKEDSENNLGSKVKTGCMRWYVYYDDGTNYTMILDHNTSNNVAWASYDDCLASGRNDDECGDLTYNDLGPVTVLKKLKEDTNNWQVEARLITSEEIVKIAGIPNWNPSSNTLYNFETTNFGKSKYQWLFDFTYGCRSYGCKYSDTESSNDGYWTSSYERDVGYRGQAWGISDGNYIWYHWINRDYAFGVRPVISVPKSKISQ